MNKSELEEVYYALKQIQSSLMVINSGLTNKRVDFDNEVIDDIFYMINDALEIQINGIEKRMEEMIYE